MSVIENFAALPYKEQREFAAGLLTKINSEHIFSEDTLFELVDIEADDLTGGLIIEVSHPDYIEVSREATWACDTEDEAESDPGYDAEYEESLIEDTKKAFKALSTVIEGYTVALEISDVDAVDTVAVEADHISNEDSGIGDYEYFGFRGHDSRPYVEVSGTIVKACECSLAFFVEPAEN